MLPELSQLNSVGLFENVSKSHTKRKWPDPNRELGQQVLFSCPQQATGAWTTVDKTAESFRWAPSASVHWQFLCSLSFLVLTMFSVCPNRGGTWLSVVYWRTQRPLLTQCIGANSDHRWRSVSVQTTTTVDAVYRCKQRPLLTQCIGANNDHCWRSVSVQTTTTADSVEFIGANNDHNIHLLQRPFPLDRRNGALNDKSLFTSALCRNIKVKSVHYLTVYQKKKCT